MKDPQNLAPYACHSENSRGRLHPEPEDAFRTIFQRDRDRIIHSAAFRRLQNKTQVFVAQSGSDHYRNRLTHTMEVSQIARNMARALRVNEDLSEAIALAHDLGHPPFAHRGEDVLARLMADYGGFMHNDQTVRVVTVLEHPYRDWEGLNLSYEAIEGVVKHNGPALVAGENSDNLPFTIKWLSERIDLGLYLHAPIEAQIVDVADDTAYCAHDVEDGLRAGFFTLDDLGDLAIYKSILPKVRAEWAETGAPDTALIRSLLRAQLTRMNGDLLETSQANLAAVAPKSPDDVRAAGQQIVRFSAPMFEELKELRAFLYDRMYRHYTVWRMSYQAEQMLTKVFEAFLGDPRLLPTKWQGCARMAGEGKAVQARVVADYVAGMTDTYLAREYHRLFDSNLNFK